MNDNKLRHINTRVTTIKVNGGVSPLATIEIHSRSEMVFCGFLFPPILIYILVILFSLSLSYLNFFQTLTKFINYYSYNFSKPPQLLNITLRRPLDDSKQNIHTKI